MTKKEGAELIRIAGELETAQNKLKHMESLATELLQLIAEEKSHINKLFGDTLRMGRTGARII